MNAFLYKRLKRITPEEEQILEGGSGVQWEIYTDSYDKNRTVKYSKLVDPDRQVYARKHTRFVYFPPHKHNYVEIFYVYSGMISHIIEGKRIDVYAGEFLFMNQHIQHEILACGENDLAVNLILMPSVFEGMLKLAGQDNILAEFIVDDLQQESETGQYLYFPVENNLCVQNLIDNITYSVLYPKSSDEGILVSTMELIFLYLINDAERMQTNVDDENENLLMLTVRRYIAEEYRKGTLSELAGRTRYSNSSLSRLIKKYTGMTFKEMQAEQRMKAAVELLSTTDLPVSEIAMSVGYENQSFFYKRFREEFQTTPSEMRRKLRKT